ncbi:hypothetical protein KP509_05G092400 [Ceratopteris richardii]|nr:hypothetical protein KP509_05G092400 [Ceratopteris richardii]
MVRSILPPLQENSEVDIQPRRLPFPCPSEVASKEETIRLAISDSPYVARGVSETANTVYKHNYSGPLQTSDKRDESSIVSSKTDFVSPHTSDSARDILQGEKEATCRNFSDPLVVQMKKDITLYQRPPINAIQNLDHTSRGTRFVHQSAPYGEPHVAHPLPLPCSTSAARVSSGSNTSSADRSDDFLKADPPVVPQGWSCCPEAHLNSHGGRWMKGALLGSGSFGKVYRGHHSGTGDMCAIKEVEIIADDPRSKECANQLSQEIAILSTLRHPNILHYKGSEMVDDNLNIYLELVSGGSIYRLLQEFNNFAEPVIRRYTRQILLGLEFLHSKNAVHRDIKCANILVDQDGRVKLADFGMAKLIGNETAPLSFKGSPYWMAPEVILQNHSGYECAIDIWSLGCTVIEMATGKPPWHQYEGYAAMFKVMNFEVPIPESLSTVAQNFVSLCLQRDPAKRPSASDLLAHPFVHVDRATNFPSQAVNDTLYQGMMKRFLPSEYGRSSGTSYQGTTRNSNHHFPSGIRSACPSFQGNMHTSKSALQLSDCLRPQLNDNTRTSGRLSDTEEYTSRWEAPKHVNHANR